MRHRHMTPDGVHHLTDSDIQSIQALLEVLSSEAIKAPEWAIVHVQGASATFWRKAPGALRLEARLGANAFELFAGFITVGIEAWKDSQNPALPAHERIGRTSIDVLMIPVSMALPILGYFAAGASVLAPNKYDYIKSWLFSTKSPHVDAIADWLLQSGGKPLQSWLARQSWLDAI